MLAVGDEMNHVENIKSDAPIKISAPTIARSFSRTKPRDSQEYNTQSGLQVCGQSTSLKYLLPIHTLEVPLSRYVFTNRPKDDNPKHVFRVAIKNPYIC